MISFVLASLLATPQDELVELQFIRAPAFDRRVTKVEAGQLQSDINVGIPLADWIDESSRKLDACWSRERPKHPML
jgi:hypothetical protein